MIRQSILVIFLVSFCVCKDLREENFALANGTNSDNGLASPVLLMLSEMMKKNSDSAKSASLKELQKKVESDRSNIQKIPKKNQEKQAIEEKRRELEQKQRELEENLVLSAEYDKYAYKNNKRQSVSFSVSAKCVLATCYLDGKPFMNMHNYCSNGITDLQLACEQKFLLGRERRDFAAETPRKQIPVETCVVGTQWREDCNECFCTISRKPACTRMKCPTNVVRPIALNVAKNTKQDTKKFASSSDEEPQAAPFHPKKLPNSSNPNYKVY